MSSIITFDIPTLDTNKELCDTNTLSYRLRYAMKCFSISQSELARKIGVKPQVIQYLCTKNIASSRFSYEIAEALGVNYSWLAAGELPMVSTNNLKNYKIPHLTWDNLERYDEDPKNLKLVSDYVFINVDNCDGCFALTLHDNSMEPRISNETILIFDKSIVATNNDFILVKLEPKKVFLVRQLQIVNNKKYLLPINQDI